MLEAAQLEITEKAGIRTSSQESGKGGLLNVVARDSIYMNNGKICRYSMSYQRINNYKDCL